MEENGSRSYRPNELANQSKKRTSVRTSVTRTRCPTKGQTISFSRNGSKALDRFLSVLSNTLHLISKWLLVVSVIVVGIVSILGQRTGASVVLGKMRELLEISYQEGLKITIEPLPPYDHKKKNEMRNKLSFSTREWSEILKGGHSSSSSAALTPIGTPQAFDQVDHSSSTKVPSAFSPASAVLPDTLTQTSTPSLATPATEGSLRGQHDSGLPSPTMSPSDQTTRMSERTGSRFPPPSDVGLKLFSGKRLSEYLEHFKCALDDWAITEDSRKISHWQRWCDLSTRQEISRMTETSDGTWTTLEAKMKKHWKHLDPRQLERPLDELKRFYRFRIGHSADALLVAVSQHHKLLCRLSKSEYDKVKVDATRCLYEALSRSVRTAIRQRLNKSDEEVKETDYDEFREWLISFATEGYEVNGSYTVAAVLASDRTTLSSDCDSDSDRSEGESLTEDRILDNTKPKSILRRKPTVSTPPADTKTTAPVPAPTPNQSQVSEEKIDMLTQAISNLSINLLKMERKDQQAAPVIAQAPRQLYDPYVGREGERVHDAFHGYAYTNVQRTGYPRRGYDSDYSRGGRPMFGKQCYYCGERGHILPLCNLYHKHLAEQWFHREGPYYFIGRFPEYGARPNREKLIPPELVEAAAEQGAIWELIVARIAEDPLCSAHKKVAQWIKDEKSLGIDYKIRWDLVGRQNNPGYGFETYDLQNNQSQTQQHQQQGDPSVITKVQTLGLDTGEDIFRYRPARKVQSHFYEQGARVYVQQAHPDGDTSSGEDRMVISNYPASKTDLSDSEVETKVQSVKRRRVDGDQQDSGDESVTGEPRILKQPSKQGPSDQSKKTSGSTSKASSKPNSPVIKVDRGKAPSRDDLSADSAKDLVQRLVGSRPLGTWHDLLNLSPQFAAALRAFLDTIDSGVPIIEYSGSGHQDDDAEVPEVHTNVNCCEHSETGRRTAMAHFATTQDGELGLVDGGFWERYKRSNQGGGFDALKRHICGEAALPTELLTFAQSTQVKMATKIQSLPCLYMKIEDPLSAKILALLDCGSECNLITLELALKCGLAITQSRITSKGLYGSSVPFAGETQATILLATRSITVEFFVVSQGLGYHDILLGMPFFNDTRLTFDYQNDRLVSANVNFGDVLVKAAVVTKRITADNQRV